MIHAAYITDSLALCIYFPKISVKWPFDFPRNKGTMMVWKLPCIHFWLAQKQVEQVICDGPCDFDSKGLSNYSNSLPTSSNVPEKTNGCNPMKCIFLEGWGSLHSKNLYYDGVTPRECLIHCWMLAKMTTISSQSSPVTFIHIHQCNHV